MLIDLDGFRRVIDTLGHEQGDRLLESVAHRLQTLSSLTPEDLVGRLGADDFVVVLHTANSQRSAAVVAEVHAAF
ncbi:MAG: diguanylate cyclase [Chloroflexi bacterium]|nr:diguanylate cyclase [Chloroflexota bacterium]